uniref:Uncharacterized protein n=1 Tax=Glossina brevipalpis TaxID=37001 RepID=A0A1A9W832_9MUSC
MPPNQYPFGFYCVRRSFGSLLPLGIHILVKIFGDLKAAESLKFANNFINTTSLIAIAILDDNYLYFFVMLSYPMALASLVHDANTRRKYQQTLPSRDIKLKLSFEIKQCAVDAVLNSTLNFAAHF